jgi:hypothetical protein
MKNHLVLLKKETERIFPACALCFRKEKSCQKQALKTKNSVLERQEFFMQLDDILENVRKVWFEDLGYQRNLHEERHS